MAFEIIRLTEEEQKEFAKRGIENPNWESRPGHPLAIPLYLTIDRERLCCLEKEEFGMTGCIVMLSIFTRKR